MLQGKAAAAATEFEQTIAIQPDAIPALTGLAWIRATSAAASLRRPGQALAMAERARQLSKGQDPQAYDALAAAYAALGVFEQAVTSARLGIQVADAAGQTLLADEMRARLQLYQNRKSFVR